MKRRLREAWWRLKFRLGFLFAAGLTLLSWACVPSREACYASVDARKVERGRRECIDQGIPWDECLAADDIRAEHRAAMKACP